MTHRYQILSMLFMVLVFGSYAVIRVVNISTAVQKVKSTGDTPAFIRISTENISSSGFLASTRPMIFPLLIKVSGGNPERVAWIQGLFSILSWGILAVGVAYSIRNPILRLFSFVWILVFSLFQYIIAWDAVLLTESLALSLMAIFVAGWLWLAKGWHWGKVMAICFTGFLWAFTRDTNAWVVLMIALVIPLLVILKGIGKKKLVFTFVFLFIFFLSNLSADLGGRWVFPLQNVMTHRILPDPVAMDYFAKDCGMPVSPALLRLEYVWADGKDRAFFFDPELEDYRSWFHESAKPCYMKWLVLHPLKSVQDSMVEFNGLISMRDIQPSLFPQKFVPILPKQVRSILFPGRFLLVLYVIVLVLMIAAVIRKTWSQNKAWWVVISLNILVLPHYMLVWHGDVMGIYRHVMIASTQFYLGAWLVALLTLDGLLSIKYPRTT